MLQNVVVPAIVILAGAFAHADSTVLSCQSYANTNAVFELTVNGNNLSYDSSGAVGNFHYKETAEGNQIFEGTLQGKRSLSPSWTKESHLVAQTGVLLAGGTVEVDGQKYNCIKK